MSSKKTRQIYLSLGSNFGNRVENLRKAIIRLDSDIPDTEVVKISSIYETEQVGEFVRPGPNYLNCVVELSTALKPETILACTQAIERKGGRDMRRSFRSAPQTIDIDILIFDDIVLTEPPQLVIPHGRLRDRRFCLEPLAELNPSLLLPPDRMPILRALRSREVQEQEVVLREDLDLAYAFQSLELKVSY